MGPETVGKLAPQRMAPYDVPRPRLQALGTFGHVQNSSVHIAEYVENKAAKSVFNPCLEATRYVKAATLAGCGTLQQNAFVSGTELHRLQ